MDGGEGSSFEEPEAAGSREVVRIDSDADLQTACLGQFSLCLLSFIDSDLGRKRIANYREQPTVTPTSPLLIFEVIDVFLFVRVCVHIPSLYPSDAKQNKKVWILRIRIRPKL